MKNIFYKEDATEIVNRINRLTSTTKQLWGKMSVSQMLAHCNVTYEFVYEEKHPKPNPFMKFILMAFVKNAVVNDIPYKKSLRTAPAFIMNDDKNFEDEKNRLTNFILRTQDLGEDYFDGKESRSFGKLSKSEWNNMFYKHLDHHLNQFGV
jgi:hypothetical protein